MPISHDITRIFREERQHALATLIRVVGDWDAAEESLQEAFEAAIVKWPIDGVPDQPRAWLLRAARNKAIDRVRR
ncbi:MAG: sigma factor, partial [Polyangiaceae bacterium]